ncbi:hypothetical protein LXL04_033532 [Taraxacum kok-saghyz]
MGAVLRMSVDIIKPADNYNDVVPDYVLNNHRYYPMFNDCIGAIDGTHMRASVGRHEEAKYIGRKGYATQNIMDVCDFNMCFTFVLAGWEGTAHDTRIFNEALRRQELRFPHPTGDKYYVVDAMMLDTQTLEGIWLHTKVHISVIIYRIFNVDKPLLCVLLVNRKRHLTIGILHCEILLNGLLECGKLGGRYYEICMLISHTSTKCKS